MQKFTEVQVEKMVEDYTAVLAEDYETRSDVVKALAVEFGVTDNSVRGKLVAEEVYVGKEKAEAKASDGSKKEDYRKAFEASFGMTLKTMDNMSKKELEGMWARFVEMSQTAG